MRYLREYILLALSNWIISTTAQQWIHSAGMCEYNIDIVDTHNALRMRVARGQVPGQPKARNMQKIAWDDNLARKAQEWADKMKLQHNPSRHELQLWVGENMMLSHSTREIGKEFDWKKVIYKWFGDHTKYKYGPITSNTAAGSYLQIVWADTKYIGCGATYFKDKGWYSKLYICYYAPAGNIENHVPYEVGKGCENLCCNDKRCQSVYGQVCLGRTGESKSHNSENIDNNDASNTYNDASNVYNDGSNIYNNARNVYNDESNIYNDARNVYNDGSNAYNDGSNAYDDGNNIYNDESNIYKDDFGSISYNIENNDYKVKNNDNADLRLSEASSKPASEDYYYDFISSVPHKRLKQMKI